MRSIILFSLSFLFSFIPALFVSGWREDLGFFKNILKLSVKLSLFGSEIDLPYRFFLAVSVILFYGGIWPYLRNKTN